MKDIVNEFVEKAKTADGFIFGSQDTMPQHQVQ